MSYCHFNPRCLLDSYLFCLIKLRVWCVKHRIVLTVRIKEPIGLSIIQTKILPSVARCSPGTQKYFDSMCNPISVCCVIRYGAFLWKCTTHEGSQCLVYTDDRLLETIPIIWSVTCLTGTGSRRYMWSESVILSRDFIILCVITQVTCLYRI